MKLVEKDGAVRFAVHAKPRARTSRVVGVHGDALSVALAAPPVDGEANAELVRMLADALSVPQRAVVVVRGHGSREKLVEVHGRSADEIRSRLLG